MSAGGAEKIPTLADTIVSNKGRYYVSSRTWVYKGARITKSPLCKGRGTALAVEGLLHSKIYILANSDKVPVHLIVLLKALLFSNCKFRGFFRENGILQRNALVVGIIPLP